MLEVGLIGIGNAGNQVVALANEKLGIDVLAINSSEKDLQTIPSTIHSVLIGDSKGAGKNRADAKIFLRDNIMALIQNEEATNLFNKEVLFIVSSTGGGTGSGSSLMMANVIHEVYPDTRIIIIGILPTVKEALSTQINTLEYLKELYDTLDDATYMLYDNDRLSKLPSPVMMNSINEAIVNDIDVIRGNYQIPTKYSSIDEKDMTKIIETKGRIVIASLKDFKEKDLDDTSIEELLIKDIKSNSHCELQRDHIVHRTGIISNISESVNNQFDSHIPTVQEFIGAPVEEFEHIAVNADRHLPNNIFLIMSGLTQVNDRIRKINDRIEEINELQKAREEDNELSDVDFNSLSSKIERKTTKEADSIDIMGIMNKFM